MDALDTIIRGIHEQLRDLDGRLRRMERVLWGVGGAVAFGEVLLRLSGCHGGCGINHL